MESPLNNVMGIMALCLSLQFNSMQVTMVYEQYKLIIQGLISQCLQSKNQLSQYNNHRSEQKRENE